MLDLLKLDIAEREIIEYFPVPVMYSQILGLYGDLGDVNRQVCCPFHGERTPSFSYAPSVGSGIWKCFGECNRGGDTIALYQFYVDKKQGRKISRTSAIRQLVSLPEINRRLSVKDLLAKPKEYKSLEEYMYSTIRRSNKRITKGLREVNLLIKELEQEEDIDNFIDKYDMLLKKGWKMDEE